MLIEKRHVKENNYVKVESNVDIREIYMSYNLTILTDYIYVYCTCICNLCMYVCEIVCWYNWAC